MSITQLFNCTCQIYEKISYLCEHRSSFLDYFDIARYFTFVAGSGLDGSFYTKGDVIRHVLESNNLTDHPSAVMIGDRKHDIIGAKENRLDSIGVLYGYGDREELSQAGADYIVEDIAGLRNLLFHQ